VNYADPDVLFGLPDPPAVPPLTAAEAEATFELFLQEDEEPRLITGAYLYEVMKTDTTIGLVRTALANGEATHHGLEYSALLRVAPQTATHAIVVDDELLFFPSLALAEAGVEAIQQGRARVRAQAKQPYPDLIQPEIRPLVGGLPAPEEQ
jgi:hypothetical protein